MLSPIWLSLLQLEREAGSPRGGIAKVGSENGGFTIERAAEYRSSNTSVLGIVVGMKGIDVSWG